MSLTHLVALNLLCVRHAISLRQLTVLVLLEQKPLKPSDLARQLQVTPAAITGQIDALEKHQLIEREREPTATPHDRRTYTAKITHTGLQVLHSATTLLAA